MLLGQRRGKGEMIIRPTEVGVEITGLFKLCNYYFRNRDFSFLPLSLSFCGLLFSQVRPSVVPSSLLSKDATTDAPTVAEQLSFVARLIRTWPRNWTRALMKIVSATISVLFSTWNVHRAALSLLFSPAPLLYPTNWSTAYNTDATDDDDEDWATTNVQRARPIMFLGFTAQPPFTARVFKTVSYVKNKNPIAEYGQSQSKKVEWKTWLMRWIRC